MLLALSLSTYLYIYILGAKGLIFDFHLGAQLRSCAISTSQTAASGARRVVRKHRDQDWRGVK